MWSKIKAHLASLLSQDYTILHNIIDLQKLVQQSLKKLIELLVIYELYIAMTTLLECLYNLYVIAWANYLNGWYLIIWTHPGPHKLRDHSDRVVATESFGCQLFKITGDQLSLI